jgi:hypothetical protein
MLLYCRCTKQLTVFGGIAGSSWYRTRTTRTRWREELQVSSGISGHAVSGKL